MYLINDTFVEAEGDVSLQGYRHALEEGAETNTFISLPVVLIVTGGKKEEGRCECKDVSAKRLNAHLVTLLCKAESKLWSYI